MSPDPLSGKTADARMKELDVITQRLKNDLNYDARPGYSNYVVVKHIDPKTGELKRDGKGLLVPWTLYTKEGGIERSWAITVPGVHH